MNVCMYDVPGDACMARGRTLGCCFRAPCEDMNGNGGVAGRVLEDGAVGHADLHSCMHAN